MADIYKLMDFLGLVVMECPSCGNKIITTCSFGSGAYHCEKCSLDDIIRFDYLSEDTLKRNREENYDMLVEYIMKHYSAYLYQSQPVNDNYDLLHRLFYKPAYK